jgi:hypothetical protein
MQLCGSSDLGHRSNAERACTKLGITGPSPRELARTGALGSKSARASSGATPSSSSSCWRSAVEESFLRSRASRARNNNEEGGFGRSQPRGLGHGQILELVEGECGVDLVGSLHVHVGVLLCWGNKAVLLSLR